MFLLEMDPNVSHYEVVAAPAARGEVDPAC
jgi:hypothetical protein